MGAKVGGTTGAGTGGGFSQPKTARLDVSLRVGEAKALLESLTSGSSPSKEVAKAVAVAIVRALNSGGGGGKGKTLGKGTKSIGLGKGGPLGSKMGYSKTVAPAGRRS